MLSEIWQAPWREWHRVEQQPASGRARVHTSEAALPGQILTVPTQLLTHRLNYQQHTPLFLWEKSLGHISTRSRTEFVLGWHQAADRQKRLSEATHLAHIKTPGFNTCGVFFFFPGPWILLICCVSNSERPCSWYMSQGIGLLFIELLMSSCQIFFAAWVLGGFKTLVVLTTSLILSSGTSLQLLPEHTQEVRPGL